jgi:DNA polymerase-1
MKFLPVDIETTGLQFNTGRILGIGYGETYNVGANSLPPLPATCQNGKFEYKWLKKASVPFDWQFDTLLAASILINRPDALDLGTLAAYYLGWETWKSDTDKLFKKKNWVALLEASPELQQALADRNIYDLKSTDQLTTVLLKRLEDEGMTSFFFEKLMPAARMLAETEYQGMRIDIRATQQKLADINHNIAKLKSRLDNWANMEINWNSPIQLKNFLRDRGYKLWTYDFKKRDTVESTGSVVLERLLPNDNIQLLLDYRGAIKLKGFLEGWIADNFEGRLYPSYNIANTRTGRLSCSAPNMQQIPKDKEIRSLFIPTEGKKFIIADYAQVEIRVVAHYTKDKTLLEVFEKDLDFYGSIAVNVLNVKCHPNEVKTKFPEARKIAKEIGLSVLYGIGAAKLASLIEQKAGIRFSKDQAAQVIKNYFGNYPGLLAFRNYTETKINRLEVLRTHYGRQFMIDPSRAFSQGVNTVVQSTASDACLFSQIAIDARLKELGIYAPLVAIIHDEVIRECNEKDARKVGKIMEEIMCNQGLDCPLKLDWVIGDSWGAKS